MSEKLDKIIENIEKQIQDYYDTLLDQVKDKLKNEKSEKNSAIYIDLIKVEDLKNRDNFFVNGDFHYWRNSNFADKDDEDDEFEFSDNTNGSLKFFTILINEPYSTIIKMIEEDKRYKGFFVDSNDNKYEFEYKLIPNTSFLDYELRINKFLESNNYPKQPYCNPYARKMFNVSIDTFLNTDANFENIKIKNVELVDIEVNYALDLVPVTNVNIIENEKINVSVVPEEMNGKKLYCVELAPNLTNKQLVLYESKNAELFNKVLVPKTKSIKYFFKSRPHSLSSCEFYYVNEKNIDSKHLLLIDYNENYLNNLGQYTLISEYEVKRNLTFICNYLNINYKCYHVKKVNNLIEIPRYINTFKYPCEYDKMIQIITDLRKKIYIEVEYSEDVIFEDKINFILAYMNSLYKEINWVGVYSNV